MSELQQYYDAFRLSIPGMTHPDIHCCGCRAGWFLSELDTIHECPVHRGHIHPEEYRWDEGLEPFVVVLVEREDGSPWHGTIHADWIDDDDDVVTVNERGVAFCRPDNELDTLERGKDYARDLRAACRRLGLNVRLVRRWMEV